VSHQRPAVADEFKVEDLLNVFIIFGAWAPLAFLR
jgi:hypothetical protein